MNLSEWIELSDAERFRLRNHWASHNVSRSQQWKQLIEQAVAEFKARYKQHSLISRITSTLNFDPKEDAKILVYTYCWYPEIIATLPVEYASFAVQQYPETIRYHIVERYNQLAIYEGLHKDTGELIFISQEPILPRADTMEDLTDFMQQYIKAFEEPVLNYETVSKSNYGHR